ncbi:putative dna-dependent rna polymerase i subunit a43-like protein [Diaporthe ampelina]|uniref:DNA-directed RNA polymerase subunit n=1 Tax=Diaporthe ampelina TaxID=1214573 RepID=A0A0G2FTJ0_9PEZI|nr:putative dna-dependent rna polymerase i subunit a43-like protein [Diaporthe ampelina]
MSTDMGSDHEEVRPKKSKRKHRHEGEGDKMDVDGAPNATETPKKEKRKHKEKKRKERPETADTEDVEAEPAASPEKKRKKHKSTDKKEKKSKHHRSAASPEKPAEQAERKEEAHEAIVPDPKEYPFFMQTFSQRIPIWPAAFDEPLTKTAREYLDPMLNRYSPKFKGVLLAYKNVNLSEQPRRADREDPPTDDTPVVLESVECYAPPFAWLTADLHLFIPSRGAWMEGVINLQSEGHIGVVCFDKFNASISRRSLPRGWTWVDQPEEEEPEPEPVAAEDPFVEGQEDGEGEEGKKAELPQLRSSGYWLDRKGDKVRGKIYFRIKNFSSGSTGDYTYLSLQGTMLDDEAERESVAEEKAVEKARRARQSPGGLLYPTMRLPEFSMTKLKDESI